MTASAFRTRQVRVLTIHVPVSTGTLRRLAAGEADALDSDPAAAAILAILREERFLGDFGAYAGVAELGLGWELFTPAETAQPTLGTPGAESRSPTVILRVHLPKDDSATVDAAIARILAAHPWEVPVIELSGATLLLSIQP